MYYRSTRRTFTTTITSPCWVRAGSAAARAAGVRRGRAPAQERSGPAHAHPSHSATASPRCRTIASQVTGIQDPNVPISHLPHSPTLPIFLFSPSLPPTSFPTSLSPFPFFIMAWWIMDLTDREGNYTLYVCLC